MTWEQISASGMNAWDASQMMQCTKDYAAQRLGQIRRSLKRRPGVLARQSAQIAVKVAGPKVADEPLLENSHHRQQTAEHNRLKNRALAAMTNRHTEADWIALCEKYGNRCLRCNEAGVPLTRDHIRPITRGGGDQIGNIQPLCRACNSAKGDDEADYRPASP